MYRGVKKSEFLRGIWGFVKLFFSKHNKGKKYLNLSLKKNSATDKCSCFYKQNNNERRLKNGFRFRKRGNRECFNTQYQL
jgi:hypothetical protein